VPDPFGYDPERLFASREEPGGDRLSALGRDGPPVLENMTLLKIDMLDLERRQGAGQDRERDQGTVAHFNDGRGGHRGEDAVDLLQGRNGGGRRVFAIRASLAGRLK